MVTLKQLDFTDASRLHRKLSTRWRSAAHDNHDLACRLYRLMCRAFIACAMAAKAEGRS